MTATNTSSSTSSDSTSTTLSDMEQSTFKTIRTFITDLAEIFSVSHHELKLYERLIEKTTLKHEIAIRKHIESFKVFCVANRKAIIERSHTALLGNIVYSEKVYINIKSILESADADTRKVIWLHILKICAFVDPSTKAREILKENASNESNLISEIMTKVEETVDLNTTNPMEAVTTIMNSGIFNDLMMGMNSKLQDGSIDLSKLMGTVESLCSNIKAGEGGAFGGAGGGDIFKLIQQIVPMPPPQTTGTKNLL
jgi:hypothetical protein